MSEEQAEGDTATVLETNVLRGDEVIKKHAGTFGSICFVVRRPGS